MRSILTLGISALAASTSCVSADTTVAVLEFGPGGTVHRTTSSTTESNTAAVSSLWNALHRPSAKRGSKTGGERAGMSVVPDLFVRADAGIVLGISGESLKSMPTAMSLLDSSASDVVGHIHVPGFGATAELLKRASSSGEVAGEDMGRRLQSTAEAAARGDLEQGMEVLSFSADDETSAAVVDGHLSRMLKTLKDRAVANGKTVVLHLVVEEGGRRRLEGEEENQNQNQEQNNDVNNNNNAEGNSYGSYEKTMYEIQTFNLFLWTAVGLVVLIFMVIGAFIDMPLMPDTLLFGETAKIAGAD